MNKTNLYEMVTQKFVTIFESGVVPWQISWKTKNGMPRNLITNRPYAGINLWTLLSKKFESPYYLTFEQARDYGFLIKKGEKASMVFYWKIIESTGKEGINKRTPVLSYYNIFNLTQIEGYSPRKISRLENFEYSCNSIALADQIIYEWKDCPEIMWDYDRAYYAPGMDTVCMPNPDTFANDERCYSTLFHELVHSTGHRCRLGRHEKIKDHQFSSQDFTQEELVAEMGAAYLCGITGIEPPAIENKSEYIKNWIKTFQLDPTVLVLAATQAQYAVYYILNQQPELPYSSKLQ